MLSKVGTWNFDIFLFERLTNGENGQQSFTLDRGQLQGQKTCYFFTAQIQVVPLNEGVKYYHQTFVVIICMTGLMLMINGLMEYLNL